MWCLGMKGRIPSKLMKSVVYISPGSMTSKLEAHLEEKTLLLASSRFMRHDTVVTSWLLHHEIGSHRHVQVAIVSNVT